MRKTVVVFLGVISSLLVSFNAFADEGVSGTSTSNFGWYALAAALAIGLPALGGALGQGKAAAAALEGIARNPGASGKIFVPMILGMALIESLVLFGLLMAFVLSGKIA